MKKPLHKPEYKHKTTEIFRRRREALLLALAAFFPE
jgi:hypothetical protein